MPPLLQEHLPLILPSAESVLEDSHSGWTDFRRTKALYAAVKESQWPVSGFPSAAVGANKFVQVIHTTFAPVVVQDCCRLPLFPIADCCFPVLCAQRSTFFPRLGM